MKRLTALGATIVLTSIAAPAMAQAPKKEPPKKEEPPATKAEAPKPDGPSKTEPTAPPPAEKTPELTEPPRETWDITDVHEAPGKTYTFVGVRYRGNIVPKFMVNLFVDEGATVYSNTVGIELDLRKDGFSLIPALSFTELGTGDIIFKDKDSTDIAGNYSMVNSGMKVIYASADLLWSAPINKQLSFEYGLGFGLGFVFGDLVNNWVQRAQNGDLVSDGGQRFARCETEGAPGSGCNRADHQNSEEIKVGGYKEKSWFDGGARPVLFPWISIPQIGLRYKPIKNFTARLGIGFSLTGFWFGLNGQYGLEQQRK